MGFITVPTNLMTPWLTNAETLKKLVLFLFSGRKRLSSLRGEKQNQWHQLCRVWASTLKPLPSSGSAPFWQGAA